MDFEDAICNNNYWIAKNNVILKIDNMDKNHLENTIKFLEKKDFKIKIQEKRYNDDGFTYYIIEHIIDVKGKYNNMKKVLENGK